jgi:peptidoglycan hydrolase-like protein with peptidoglycan-binding domain
MIREQQIAWLTSEIARLKALIAQIIGQTSANIPSTFTFNTTLMLGANMNDVLYLQKLLNQDPATQVAATGFGSPGKETMHFGPATKRAVIKFQEKYAQEILYPAYQHGTGIVGKATRKKLNSLLGR